MSGHDHSAEPPRRPRRYSLAGVPNDAVTLVLLILTFLILGGMVLIIMLAAR
ncbi:MAG: hypothetical protein IRY83_09225 [Chloroflexi bacterium]|nr:hypothetical protein [Chloroflexota bacterium]